MTKSRVAALFAEEDGGGISPEEFTSGFNNARGTKIPISNEAKARAANIFKDPEELPDADFGFKTGKGGSVQISAAAKSRAANLFAGIDNEPDQDFQPIPQASTAISKPQPMKISPIRPGTKTSPKPTIQKSPAVSPQATYQANQQLLQNTSLLLSSSKPIPSSQLSKRPDPPPAQPEEPEDNPSKQRKLSLPVQKTQPITRPVFSSPRGNLTRGGPPTKVVKPKFTAPQRIGTPTKPIPTRAEILASKFSPNKSKSPDQKKSSGLADLESGKLKNRVSLQGLKTPKLIPAAKLQHTGFHPQVIFLNFEKAKEFRFVQYAVKSEELLLFQSCTTGIGAEHMHDALKSVGATYATLPWVINHYQLIVRKLAAMERAYPEQFFRKYLLPDRVFLQLRYRYEREINRNQRSPIKKFLEKDCFESRMFTACICSIVAKGSDPFLIPEDPEKEPFTPAEILITDGWYTIVAVLDRILSQQLTLKRLFVGQKIKICAAKLSSADPTTPLENQNVKLTLHANGTKRARWSDRLGHHKRFMFSTSISSISVGGGVVPAVDVLVTRIYPPLFIERYDDYSVVRNEADKEIQQKLYKIRLDSSLEKRKEHLLREYEESTKGRKGTKIYSAQEIAEMHDGETIYEALQLARDEFQFKQALSSGQSIALRDYTDRLRIDRMQEIN